MDVKDRVAKIKEFFVTLSISDGGICVVTKFPETWWMGDVNLLKEKFKCELVMKDGCAFFITELDNGFDTAFDCIEYIIATNNAIFEKKALLETKVKELSELFVSEPLSRLKTLYFAFDEKTKKRGKKSTTKDELPIDTTPLALEEQPSTQEEEVVVQEEQTENNVQEESSSLLAMAKELTM